MSNIVEEVKEVISPEDLANALKNKVEDSKKEKQEKLVQLAYSYVKVISKAIANCPNEKIGDGGYELAKDEISLNGINGVVDFVNVYVREDSVNVQINYTGFYLPLDYDVAGINEQLDKYNISIKVSTDAENHCRRITVDFDPQKKKKLENVDVNALDEVSRTVENKQPVGFVPPTSAYEEISKSVKTVEEPAYDDISRTTKTSSPMGFVPNGSNFDTINRVYSTPNPEGFVVKNEVDYNNYGRSK